MGIETQKQESLSQFQLNILLVALLFSSTAYSITFKAQQRVKVDGEHFNHPFMQSITMFIGEALCYPIFIWYKKKYNEKYEASRQKALAKGYTDQVSKYIFAIPTIFDFITSTITFFSMSMIPFNLIYLVRCGNKITTVIFSVIFLKRKLFRQNVLGIFLVFSGIVFIGVFALVFNQDDDENSSNLLLGLFLTVCSFFTFASQMVIEELLFSKYHLHPFQVVGYEGFWGIFITWIGINIFSFIPCPSIITDCPNGMMESAPQFFHKVFSFKEPLLFFLVILGIFITLLFNSVCLIVTKYASAIVRSLLMATSPFLLWLFSLAIGWDRFTYIQLIGFLVITLGTLIYNEIIILPFFGFNKNLKRNLVQKEQEEDEEQYDCNNQETIISPLFDEQTKVNFQPNIKIQNL